MKHKPPSVTRLLNYGRPLAMTGDPPWSSLEKDPWRARQAAVYEAMIAAKRAADDPGVDGIDDSMPPAK